MHRFWTSNSGGGSPSPQMSMMQDKAEYSGSGAVAREYEPWSLNSSSTFRHPFQTTPSRVTYSAVVSPHYTADVDDSLSSPPTTAFSPSSALPPMPTRSFLPPAPTPVSFSHHDRRESVLRFLIPLIIFLPVPPLLSLIYLAVGHAVLKSSSSSTAIFSIVPIINSLKAGVVGGTILAIPILALVYLLLFSFHDEPADSPLDFFDDDESRHLSFISRLSLPKRSAIGYVGIAILAIFLGVITGPLGVACFPKAAMLTANGAAKAGVVGGLVLSPAIVGVSGVVVLLWRVRLIRESQRMGSITIAPPATSASPPTNPPPPSTLPSAPIVPSGTSPPGQPTSTSAS